MGEPMTIYRVEFGSIAKQENVTPSATGKTWSRTRMHLFVPGEVVGRDMFRRSDGWTDNLGVALQNAADHWETECARHRRDLEAAKARAGNYRGQLRKWQRNGGASDG